MMPESYMYNRSLMNAYAVLKYESKIILKKGWCSSEIEKAEFKQRSFAEHSLKTSDVKFHISA